MPTKTHTYEEQRVVTETHHEEVTYCSGCGWPIADGKAIKLFHGPMTSTSDDIDLHPACYRTLIRPPDGGHYHIESYDDYLAFAEAVSARDRDDDARYRVPGTALARSLLGWLARRPSRTDVVAAFFGLSLVAIIVAGVLNSPVGMWASLAWFVVAAALLLVVE